MMVASGVIAVPTEGDRRSSVGLGAAVAWTGEAGHPGAGAGAEMDDAAAVAAAADKDREDHDCCGSRTVMACHPSALDASAAGLMVREIGWARHMATDQSMVMHGCHAVASDCLCCSCWADLPRMRMGRSQSCEASSC